MIKKIEIIQNNVFASYTIPTKDIIMPTNPIKFQRRTHENGEYVMYVMYVVYTKQIYRSNKELNWNENEENEKDEEDEKDEEKNKKILMN